MTGTVDRGEGRVGLLGQALLTLALSVLAVAVLVRLTAARWPQGVVLAAGAIIVGLIGLTVFFGPSGGGFGLLCAVGVVAGALVLYGILCALERWAQSRED